MVDSKALRLLAEDIDDLKIVSAAIQDAVLKAEALKYDGKRRRFTIELNRFQWEDRAPKGAPQSRVRALLAFDGVLGVQSRAVTKADPDMVMSLLSINYTPSDTPPGGEISILFSGDGELKLEVEVLDVTLLDSNYVWSTRNLPDHNKKRH